MEVVETLAVVFGDAEPAAFAACISQFEAAATAMSAGSLSLAAIALAFTRLPDLDAAASERLAALARLRKAGFNPDEPRDSEGKWEHGSATAVEHAAFGEISPSPPAYRANAISQADWDRFAGALLHSGLTAREQAIYSQIFAAEGGFGIAPGNGAMAGITPATLGAAIANGYLPEAAEGSRPHDLTAEQIIAVYNYYFDDIFSRTGGHAVLSTIGDLPTAAAFADTVFREGPDGIVKVQHAINDTIASLPPEERDQLGLSSAGIRIDKQFGPESLQALRALVAAGHGPDVRSNLADRRLRGNFKSEVGRIEFYRCA